MKPFTSIKQKLIFNTMAIVSCIFLSVLLVVTIISVQSVTRHVMKAERYIRSGLIVKGKTLTGNNSRAMRGMVEDNAFSAIQALVSSTVSADDDIVYGIFTDNRKIPWVTASAENPMGLPENTFPLTDEISNWASSLINSDLKLYNHNKEEIIEFASPIVDRKNVLGVIRYGFSTRSMHRAIEEVFTDSTSTRNQMIQVLVFIFLLSLSITFIVIRHQAIKITQPVDSLLNSSKIITEGDYNISIKPQSDDEIGNLANHFEIMRLTIKEYTDHLQDLVDEKMHQVNDILNNIDQGLFTINLNGKVNREHSLRANEILMVEDVASCDLSELLRLNQKQSESFSKWLDVVKKNHARQRWKKLIRLAPVHCIKIIPKEEDSGISYISISYQRIYDKNHVLSKIMILAADETETYLKERQLVYQRKKHENEMKAVLAIANTTGEELSEFMEDTNARLGLIKSAINKSIQQSENQRDNFLYGITDDYINLLYRNIHTIKGNAGSYGFESLALNAHKVEDMLERFQNPEKSVFQMLNAISECIEVVENDLVNIHQKIDMIKGPNDEVIINIPQNRINQIQECCRLVGRNAHTKELRTLLDECLKLTWKPLKNLTIKYEKIVLRAARILKKEVKFIVINENYLYPPDILLHMDEMIVHILRNAVAHGIEPFEIREELGKGVGSIIFELLRQNDIWIIKISDDGMGIDTEKLIKIGLAKGLIPYEEVQELNHEQKLGLIFRSGLSTSIKTTDISGRGIGLDVVYNRLKELGGSVFIDSEIGKGSTFTLNIPIFSEKEVL